MEYLDNLYTRLALKCAGNSPSSGYYGPFVIGLTVDMTNIKADSTLITADMTTITVDDLP
jgi:hypothetical protein